MKTKMAVFDMDGTLFDTCESNHIAYELAMKESGIDKTISVDEFKKKCFGKNYKEFLPTEYGIVDAETIEKIHDIKKKKYKSVLEKYGKTFGGLLDLLKCIKSEYVVVLWTTASKVNTYELLDVFQCTRNYVMKKQLSNQWPILLTKNWKCNLSTSFYAKWNYWRWYCGNGSPLSNSRKCFGWNAKYKCSKWICVNNW